MNGLALWFDATNIDGNTNSNLSHNNPINEWKDLNGNNNHLMTRLVVPFLLTLQKYIQR